MDWSLLPDVLKHERRYGWGRGGGVSNSQGQDDNTHCVRAGTEFSTIIMQICAKRKKYLTQV